MRNDETDRMSEDRSGSEAGDLGHPRLTEADELALDALVEAGFEPDAVAPDLRERATRVAGLLGLLETEPFKNDAQRERLTERLIDSVRTVVHASAESSATLNRDDSEALEAFVMKGYDAARVPSALREGARAHQLVHAAITQLGPENETWIRAGRGVRTESIVSAIAASARLESDMPRRVRSFRFADLLAAAAAIMLVSALTMPVLNAMTEDGRRRVCTSNLQAAGLGLGMYTLSNNDSLPMATAGFGGGWSQVGRPGRSQSANLFTLVRTGHVQPWDLTCPGNESAPVGPMDRDAGDWGSLEEVSYSYRLMPEGASRADLLDGRSVMLADRSPILLAGLAGRRISPEASSPNHGREGQHLLRLDDSVVWVTSPVLENGDNIWLPRTIERMVRDTRKKFGIIEGSELPETPEDTFLGP